MRVLFLAAMLFAMPAAAETEFHFYGAEDCPPCMAFKHNHLPGVQATGETSGFAVAENVIARTADVPRVGIYGEADPLLRDALAVGDLTPYPPIFFLTKDDRVLSVHGANWREAMDRAVSAVSK